MSLASAEMNSVEGTEATFNIDDLPLAFIELDLKGKIVRMNRLALDTFGGEPKDVAEQTVWELMPADEALASKPAFFNATGNGEPLPSVRRSLYVKSGQYRTFNLHRSYNRNSTGAAVGVRLFAVDITQATSERERALRETSWLQSVFASLPDAVFVIDGIGFIRMANPAIEKITGWLPEELVGEVVERRLPILRYEPTDGIPLNHQTRLERQLRGIATILDHKRYQIQIEMLTSPIVDRDSGVVSGAAITLRPIPDLINAGSAI